MKRMNFRIMLSLIFISSSICMAQEKSETKDMLQPADDDPCGMGLQYGTTYNAYNGKVVRVLDGQTIEVTLDKGGMLYLKDVGKKVKLRLAGLSAPTLKEKFGKESKKNLEKWLLNRKIVILDWSSRDVVRGRRVVRVVYETVDIGLEQIKAALARYDGSTRDVMQDEKCRYKLAGEKAKADGVGIWQQVIF